MNETNDIQRLSNAIAGLAATITEILTERLNEVASVQEQKIARHMIEPILTKKQVAEQFQVTIRTIDHWMSVGHLPYYRLGRNIRFRQSDILGHLDERNRIGHGVRR